MTKSRSVDAEHSGTIRQVGFHVEVSEPLSVVGHRVLFSGSGFREAKASRFGTLDKIARDVSIEVACHNGEKLETTIQLQTTVFCETSL